MYTLFHGESIGGKHVDEILREYFPDPEYKGVFFDVGSYEPITINNSYHFEKNGWECYCFEANTSLIPLLKENRKNVFNYAISNTNKDAVTFNVVTLNHVSPGWAASYSAITVSDTYKQIFGFHPEAIVTQITVPQRTLDTIIETEISDLKKIDLMSLDIEGGELDCLYGLNLNKFPPSVIVIENVAGDPEINSYLSRFGYTLDRQTDYNQYYVSNTYSHNI